jgi:flavin-dependent dehydrogenase
VSTPIDDMLVCGAGLAGLSAAMTTLRAHPGARVTLIERRRGPAPEGGHKVGESFVELSSWHLRHDLDLADHLARDQLPKLGLRFFMRRGEGESFESRLEYGVFPHRERRLRELTLPTYNVDRGRLENHLRERLLALGATFLEGRVDAIELGAPSVVCFRRGHGTERRAARWVVDATGHRGLLKRSEGLAEPIAHDADASWIRVDRRLDVEELGPAMDTRIERGLRWRSTNHLVGEGYWVWLIPLASGGTSVGLVTDPRRRRCPGRRDELLAFFDAHEPELGRAIDPKLIRDHRVRRGGAYGCRRLFSADGWAVVGDAGFFLDPLYSPGGDFIAIQSRSLARLVGADGADVVREATFAERLLQQMFDQHLTLYRGLWDVVGDPLVMATKVAWDTAAYFAFNLTLFQHAILTDPAAMSALRPQAEQVATLHRRAQGLFRRAARRDRRGGGHVDQFAPDFLYELYARSEPGAAPDGEGQVRANLAVLDAFLSEGVGPRLRSTTVAVDDFDRLWREAG